MSPNPTLKILMLAVALAAVTGCGTPPDPALLKPGGLGVGDKAYNFSLMDSNGHLVKLSDLKPGWNLVLILYRGFWCSACQNQLLNLKEDFPKFQALHTALAAVSVDTMEDSAHFTKEWRFPFPLLADPQFKVIDAYGARHPGGHEGHDISKPSVIIIDPQKIIRFKHVGKNPIDRPEDDEILYLLQQMERPAPKK